MRLMIFDNRDSYTFNLVECFRKIGVDEIHVMNEDDYSSDKLADCQRIVLGPGPGLPNDHPILFDILEKVEAHQLVLGICLGHEAIAIHNGGKVKQLDRVFHGDVAHVKATESSNPIYCGMPTDFQAGLYHSWIIDEDTLPDNIGINSRSELGLIMGIQHKRLPQYGFQFHPESYRTQNGLLLLRNWYNLI